MYSLKYDDMFADNLTNAYEPYDKECEIKIIIDISNEQIRDKYNVSINSYDYDLYMLVTINKKLKNITYLITECNLKNGETISLPSNYNFEEKELIKKIAIQKMREEMFKNY